MALEPRISVVLPTYNSATYVERAVESVLDQTLADLELLVVDDGSTDGTLEAVRSFEDDRVRVIEREATGLASALNRGVAEARAGYVARQDADDVSAPGRLEAQVEYLDANPSVALVGTGANLVDGDGSVIERRRVLAAPDLADLRAKNRFVHGSVAMRRSAVEAVGGYDERFAVSEDYDLWLRLAAEYPVRNVDRPLYSLRLHGGSIYGSQLRAAKLYARLAKRRLDGRGADALFERVEADGIEAVYETLSPAERAALHREMAMDLLRYGRPGEAREQCRSALAHSRTDAMTIALYALSVGPPPAVAFARRAYRALLNYRIRRRNAST